MSPVVGRVEEGSSRWYFNPLDAGDRFESVTSIISASNNKAWLAPWGSKIAAIYAVEKHDAIGTAITEFGPAAAVDLIKGEAKRRREMKADIGSFQHDIVEALVKDTPIPSVPDHLADVEIDGELVDLDAIADGFLNFVADHNPRFLLSEATVVNHRHRYAGTLDLVLELPNFPEGRRRVLVDVKTGAYLDSTMSAQLAAYRRADTIWVDDLGNTAPMLDVDFAAVLHIRPGEYERGYKLIETPAEDVHFEWFTLMTRQFHMGLEIGSHFDGRVLYKPLPDGSQPPPMVEDVNDLGRYRKPLMVAGVRSVTELLCLDEKALRDIKGIGPAALQVIAAVCAPYRNEEKAVA